ncbi:trypsin-like peptidase domain-containing protein [Dehalococcoidia bacterium]|nr:trypsin-like peptidase domain-containing protein [Dehalococcoidia bacterium]
MNSHDPIPSWMTPFFKSTCPEVDLLQLIKLATVVLIALIVLGCQGPQGPQGPQGSQGIQGPQGIRGDDGSQGIEGQSGSEGPEGAEGPEGPKGPRGSAGSRGSQGLRGNEGPSGAEDAEFTDFISGARDGIVLVDDSGSGVRISHSEIITAQHVVGTQAIVSVTIKGVGKVLGTVKGYDTARHIALITISSNSSGTVVDYSKDGETWNSTEGRYNHSVGIGDEIAIMGYETSISDTTPMITYGRVGVRWNIVPGDISAVQTDAAVTSGMSGGGVFNKYGELVGMLYSSTTIDNMNARFLATEEIAEIIPELKTGQKE